MDGGSGRAGGVRVKNRAPAPIQITAEQLLVEARERAEQQQPPPPKRHITDPQELAEYRLKSRKEYEDRIRMNRANIGVWLRYAKWEEGQKEIERARSIYERTLDVDYKQVTVWIRYAEMEMRCRFVNRARNVLDRAVAILPRVDSLWYKYTYMEELLGNVNGARTIFERWMQWEPEEQAWLSYIKLELRAGQTERARAVYERYCACHPHQAAYIRYAKWEERNAQKALARRVYERACEELRLDEQDEQLFLSFAKFEERCAEMERARAIYRYGLERLPKRSAEELYKTYTAFEKSYGDRQGVEEVVSAKRRAAYEAAVTAQPRDYDSWFDYARLEESEGERNIARVRDVYERAIANPPPALALTGGPGGGPVHEKRLWRRYIHLWIRYAVYEELDARDVARARAVYAACLKLIPHKQFTFAKIWLLAAQLEIRAHDVSAARKLLGIALGMCPKQKVLKGYIELELALGEIDRVRKLYEKYLTLLPTVVTAWVSFANLERSLGEDERADAIFELAVSQPVLDMPEVAWKAYIDAAIDGGKLSLASQLYERLLSKTSHVKVWLSYATFQATVCGDAAAARTIYKRGYAVLKDASSSGGGLKSVAQGDVEVREQRALLLDAWRGRETTTAQEARAAGREEEAEEALRSLREVEGKLPQKVKKKRAIYAGGVRGPVPTMADSEGAGAAGDGGGSGLGEPVAFEEFYDYVFPDDNTQPAALKLLALAQKWKASGGAVAASAMLASSTAAASTTGGGGGDAGADTSHSVAGLLASATAAYDPSAIDLDALDDEGAGAGEGQALPAASGGYAGVKRGRPAEFDQEGEGEGDGEGAGAGSSSSSAAPAPRRRALALPAARSSAGAGAGAGAEAAAAVEDDGTGFRAHISAMPQSTLLEEDEGDGDIEHGREVEREIEDELHRPSSSGGGQERGAMIPMDLFTEADGGDAADRDV